MKSVKRERCPKCDSVELVNLVLVEEGQPIKIYVKCAKCKTFVARYTLDYYTSNMDYESMLEYASKCYSESGRTTSKKLKSFNESIKKEFEECLKLIREKEDKKRVEEIINETEEKE